MARPRLTGVLRYVRHLVLPEGGGDPSDSQLLQQFVAQRDEGAFAALLQRHGPLVLGVCRQVLRDAHAAEDAFQATFLVLARKAASIRRKASLAAWLYRVAWNLARTAKTSAARRRTHEQQAGTMSRAHSMSEPALADWQPLLHDEVNRLPEKYRVPVVLCYFQGKTHEAAGRELGWPVGTVKGRLARARDLLRTRLTRRGLTLAAGALATRLASGSVTAAVPATLLGSTLQAAVRLAAGQTVVGVASTRAILLAKGALPTVAGSRVTLVAALLLIAGVVGAVGSVLALRPRGDGGPGGQPERPPTGQERHESPLRVAAVPAPLKGADPEQREIALPIDRVHVHRLEQSETDKWSGGAAVVEDPPVILKPPGEQVKVLKDLFDHAAQAGGHGKAEVKAGLNLNVLAVGRMLFPPDKVAVRSLVRRAGMLELEILYTHDRSYSSYSREDMKHPWHPVVQLPVDLPPGPYQLAVTWRQVASLPDGKRLDQGTVHLFDFTVIERLVASKPVRAHGVDFQTVVDAKCPVPAPGGFSKLDLGLRVTNRGDKELLFNLLDTVWITLKSPDGKVLRRGGGRDELLPVAPLRIGAGRTATVFRSGRVEWLPDDKSLRLRGPDGAGGTWHFVGLVPGKYLLSITYDNKAHDHGHPFWVGKAQTEEVAFTIVSPVPPQGNAAPARGDQRTTRFRHGSSVSSVVYFPDGKTLAAGGHVGRIGEAEEGFGIVRMWDAATGKELAKFQTHGVAHVAVSADGKALAFAGTADGVILLWDVAAHHWICQFNGRRGWGGNLPLAFAPDGKSLAAGGSWCVGIGDIATGKIVWHDVPEREPVYKLAFSPDGRTLAYSCVDLAPLRFMEVATWKELPQFRGLPRGVKVAAFSPDGETVALQQPDHSIRLCGLASGKELRRFKGHRAEITTLAFSPDGQTLASAGKDETIRLWAVATGKERGQFRGDQGTITALSWKPDGTSLASGGADGTVRVWAVGGAHPP